MNSPDTRSTLEVFQDHLQKRLSGDVEEDISQNYARDIVVLSNHGTFRGHAGLKQSAGILDRLLPNAKLKYTCKLTEGEVAFLEWIGASGDKQVRDGTDTFLIRDGKILVQTIHYTVCLSEKQALEQAGRKLEPADKTEDH